MLKVAIIGCGRISKKHIEILTNKSINNAKLVSVCDIDIQKAENVASKFEITYYDDMHKMLENEDIDIVSILTPSGLHAKHTIEIAKYKKHIIVEKPMALTLEDADEMIKSVIKMELDYLSLSKIDITYQF